MKATVYKLTNTVTGMIYIGVTKTSLEKRMSSHRTMANKGVNSEIYKAMREYGHRNFEILAIDECEEDMMFQLEEIHINEMNTLWPHGYNTVTSHLSGGTQSEIVKEKKSKGQLRRWDMEDRKEWSVRMLRMFSNPKHKAAHHKAVAESNRKHSSKIVLGTSLNTGEVMIFESANAAAIHIGGHHSKVSNVCHGKRNHHKHWTFSYLE